MSCRAHVYLVTILIYSLVSNLGSIRKELFEGDECVLSSGRGRCTPLTKCPSVYEMVDKQKKKPELSCKFKVSDVEEIVCCPLTSVESTTVGFNSSGPAERPAETTTQELKGTTEGGKGGVDCPLHPYEAMKKVGREHLPWNKCVEYSQRMYRCDRSSDPPMHVQSMSCHQPLASVHQRIIGGEEAGDMEFPHMALLGYKQGTQTSWGAGGTLISEFYVLTAAHVLEAAFYGKVHRVKLGVLDIRMDSPDTTYGVEALHHDEYNFKEKCYNDIGLIRLDRDRNPHCDLYCGIKIDRVQFSERIRPACLPSLAPEPLDARRVVSGWGVTQSGNQELSNILRKVTIIVFPDEECISRKTCPKQEEWANKKLICAGGNHTSQDSCQGDSGGPMQVNMRGLFCQYLVLGIVSSGQGCGFLDVPAPYTGIAPYMDWIVNITWPNGT